MTWVGMRVNLLVLVGSFVLSAALASDGYVHAQASARLQKSVTASVSAWGAVIAVPSATPTSSPFVIAWAPTQGLQIVYVDVVNTGFVSLTGQDYVIDTKDPNSARNNVPQITFTACSAGSWNTATDVCSGTSSVIGTQSNGTLSSNFSLASAARLSLRLSVTKVNKVAWTTTLNMNINRSQIRTATTTNS